MQKLKKKTPYVTLLLLASCALTTIPQFFLNDYYDQITGSPFRFGMPWGFSLMTFSHSPEILAQHFIGNILVLLVMGTFIELVIGSGGLAFISLITFFSTNMLNILKGTDTTHGASGIFWGYHLVVFFMLVVYAEKYGIKKLFREQYFRLFVILTAFNFIGINVFEVFIMKKRFFENFGQTIHLFSMLSLVPFILIDREKISVCVTDFLEGKSNDGMNRNRAIIVLLFVCAVNLVATGYAAYRSTGLQDIVYSFAPETSGPDDESIQNILVTFNHEMRTGSEKNTGYSINSVDEKISWKTGWLDGRKMSILLSRKMVPGDTIRLHYIVTSETGLQAAVEINWPQ